jgi:hypothetical protein
VPGIGKSRLVWELKELVEAEPELTVWRQGRCLPYGEGVALWALAEIVKAQAGVLDTDAADAAGAKLALTVGDLVADEDEAAWVAGHLRPLVGLAGPTHDTGDRLEEAFGAWRRFLEGLAEQGPAVLVVEDLHWADELLLEFLDHLVDWAAEVPLLVVATARPELLARRPGLGGGKPNSAIASLAPLSDQDTARLVAGLLDQTLLPAELQAMLLARAGGNPLYAEEYVRMLADRGYLTRTRGGWRLERAGELPLPESVQGIIAARLDALAPRTRRCSRMRPCSARSAGRVPWPPSPVAGERQYAFRHVLVRDVAYGQLPRAARADKHRRAAAWIEELAPDRAEDRAELAAHHWQAALQFARAAGQDTGGLAGPARLAFREAGDRAFALNALAAAARWYRAALELWPAADPERARLLMQLGRTAWWAEEPDAEGLAEALEEARDGLLADGDRVAAAEAESLSSTIAQLLRQGRRAEEHARRAVALVEGTGPSPAAVRVLNQRASLSLLQGRAEDAIRVARQALAMAEPLGLDDERGRSLTCLGGGRLDLGDLGGRDDLEQAVAIHLATRSVWACDAYINLASSQIAAGDLARGFELQVRAREVAERFGLTLDLRHLRFERVSEDYWTGRWQAAVTALERLFAESAAGASSAIEPQGRIIRGWVRLATGDPAGALDDLDTGLADNRAAGDVQFELPAAGRARPGVAGRRRSRTGRRAGERAAGRAGGAEGPLQQPRLVREPGGGAGGARPRPGAARPAGRRGQTDPLVRGGRGGGGRGLRGRRRPLRCHRVAARRGVGPADGGRAAGRRRAAGGGSGAGPAGAGLRRGGGGGRLAAAGRGAAGRVRLTPWWAQRPP